MAEAQEIGTDGEPLVRSLERRNAELTVVVEQLRASEERWRTIVRTEPECVKIVDPEGKLLEMNPAGLAMLDAASVEEVRVKNLLEWVAPEHRDNFAHLHRNVMNGESGELEFEVIGASGVRRWLHTHAAPLRNQAGEIIALLGISHNITSKRQLEEQLRQAQKMEAVGRLAGGIAHDFNNLLMVIQGFASILQESAGDADSSAHAAREIVQAAERASSLTQQLLAFSRRQVIQPQQMNLNDVVSTVAKMLQRVVGEDVTVQLHLDQRPLRILADRGMMEQMLTNLVINARDAMPSGGTLTIETKEKDATHVSLTVRDTGCGIDEKHMSHIFEPFFTTKDAGKGTGLGLATVFGIVTQHGGTIRVESMPGQGSQFEIVLPESTAKWDPPSVDPAHEKPKGGSETILVVEDEAAVRQLTRTVLEREGYRVIVAASGAEALQMWDQYKVKVDLMLTDLVMPAGVNGRQLAEKLQMRQPDLKVIFTSGYTSDVAGNELTLNETNFIPKPSKPKRILEAVRRSLDS